MNRIPHGHIAMGQRIVSDHFDNAFFGGVRSERLPFVVNDVVRIKDGKMKGQTAWVVRLRSVEPDIRYLIELRSGAGDVEVAAAEIESDG